MATVPTTPLDSSGSTGSGSNSGGGGGARKHRGSPFTSWLKKGNSSLEANSKKLASPAEEIKLVFLRQLELSSFDFNGKHYHSVFTGGQIVDIILNHFGLPDRKLATNVASRLIDCSLYTHVSGPSSQGAATAAAGLVIDSNAEMYTLTSDALAALKALHKGDTLQRAKTHTRRRYMELRGHLYTRSVDSQGTSSDGSSQHGSAAGRASCEPACSSSSSSPLSQALRPPPLDLSAAQLKGTAAAARAAAHLSDVSNSPSDTLVALGPGASGGGGGGAAAEEDAAAGLALREVCIPTGDFGGLLNTWSFLGAGASASVASASARHPQLLGPGGSTARSAAAYLQAGAMESDDSDSGAAVRRRQRRRAGRAAARVSRDLESAELARQRRWAVCPEAGEGGGLGGGGALRRCPSAPSLSEQASDSDASFRTASVRDSAAAQQQQRASRDSWFGGSQLSDVTAASSYGGGGGGGAACPLAPASRLSLGRLSVASGSPQPWHTPPPIAAPPPAQAAAAALPANAAADSYDSGGRPSASGDASAAAGAMPLLQLQLWRDTVPAQLLQALGPEAVAQQEAIHELVGTERAYLRDLELIDAVFAARLLAQPEVMERTRALGFLHSVFFNYRALIDNSRRLCAQLAARQQASGAVVAGVGDILDAWADDLAAFVEYSVHVPAAQSELEAELLASPQLAQFLADAEAAPEARRLPVQSFIGRPATRFARYPLLLDAIVKRAPPDAERLRSAAAKVRAALAEIDGRTGDGAAAHRIRQINQRLSLPAGARDSLALDSPARRLVKEGVLYVPETGARALVFLFDNSLIVAAEERVAHAKGVSRYVADDRIIPISMLDAGVPPPESSGALVGIREALRLQPAGGQRPALLRHSSSSSTVKALPRTSSSSAGTTTTSAATSAAQAAAAQAVAAAPAAGLPLAFLHIGCRSLCRTLLVASEAERDQWLAAIARRICVPQTLVEAYTELRLLSDRDFAQHRAPLCSALFAAKSSACQMVLFGSKDGLHLGIYGVPTSVIRVSQPGCVTKIHILHDFNLVIVLSDSNLLVYSLSAIEKSTLAVAAPQLSASQVGVGGGGAAGLVAGTKIASSVTFFDVGVFMSAPLIVLMKLRGSKSHFKCIQPRFNPIESAHGSSDSSTSEDRRDYGSSSAGVGDTTSSSGHRGSEPPPPPLRSLSAGVDTESDMPTLRIVYQGTRTSLHLISEFGVPGKARRVHFLRRKLCIVSTKSFEIVDVQTSRLLRSLPDPMDDDFSFVIHSNNSGLALASHKVGRDFLLCYESFAFYIDNFGRRSRPHVFIRWEMRPSHISFRHPYVVAINPKFIEVRHIETGVLLSIIRIKNAVCLNLDSTDTILHIAIAPTTTIGTALLLPSGASSPPPPPPPPPPGTAAEPTTTTIATASMDESSGGGSAMPRPVSAAATATVSATTRMTCMASADSIVQGYIVPGLSGTSGKRLFPEGCPSHYRIVEVRLPPLKSSMSTRPTASAASR